MNAMCYCSHCGLKKPTAYPPGDLPLLCEECFRKRDVQKLESEDPPPRTAFPKPRRRRVITTRPH